MALFETATDLTKDREMIARRYHGVIEIRDGDLHKIRFRPWPTFVSQLRAIRDGSGRDCVKRDDVCHLYYDQILRMPGFLVLKYVASEPGTSFRSVRAAALVLDEVARIKHSDAIVSEVSNAEISDRLLERWGWESHVPSSHRRHFIKRFYGNYPSESQTQPADEILPTPLVEATSIPVS